MSKCGEVYKKAFGELGKTVTNAEWGEVQKLFGLFSDTLEEAGMSRSIIKQLADEKTMGAAAKKLDEALDAVVAKQAKQLATDGITKVRDQSAHVQNVSYLKKITKPGATAAQKMDGVLKMLFTDSKGTWAFEGRIRNLTAKRHRELDEGLKAIDEQYIKYLKTGANADNVAKEIYNVMDGIKTPDSKDRAIAQTLVNQLDKQGVIVNRIGGKYANKRNGIPILFDYGRLLGKKNDFVHLVSSMLDPVSIGDDIARTNYAEKLYDAYTAKGGIVDPDKIVDAKGNPLFDKPIKFKDGDAWVAVNKAFGRSDLPAAMLKEIDRLAKKESAYQMFGSNPQRGLEKLIEHARDNGGNVAGSATDAQIRKAQARFDKLTKVHLPASVRFSRSLGIIRNLQTASKLGGTLISSIGDPIMAAYSMRQFYGSNPFEVIHTAFKYGTQKYRRDYAASIGAWSEGHESYFGHQYGMGFTDKASRLTSDAANMIMRLGGIDFWTGGWKAGVVAHLDNEIGKMISAGHTWEDVGTNNAMFRRNMELAGVTEADWKRMADTQHLDHNSLFDVFLVPETGAEQKGLTYSLQEKMSNFYTNAVEGSILTPGMADSEVLSLGFHPGTIAYDITKSLTQFLSFPLAANRKLLYRTLTDDMRGRTDKIASMATFTALTIAVNMLSVESKEVMKGNQPYGLDSKELFSKSLGNQPWGMVVDMFMKLGGTAALNSVLGVQDVSRETAVDYLGPTMRLIYDTFGGVAKMAGITQGDDKGARAGASQIAKSMLQTVPGQNLWWAAAAYRYFVLDTVSEMIDPTKFRRSRDAQQRDVQGRVSNIFTNQQAGSNQNFIAKGITDALK